MAQGGLTLLLVLVATVAIAGTTATDGLTARPSSGTVGHGRGAAAHRGGSGFVSGDTLWTMKRTQFGQVRDSVKHRRVKSACRRSPWSVRSSTGIPSVRIKRRGATFWAARAPSFW